MKAYVVQPLYSMDFSKIDAFFKWEMDQLDACDDSLDIIVFPEGCDIPCLAATKEDYYAAIAQYTDKLLQKASETAKRCNAIVIVNGHAKTQVGYRNSTFVFDRKGELAGRYDKQHLTPGESSKIHLDDKYTFDYEPVYVLDLEGVRYAFLICYDFYFYEAYAAIARKNVDVIIGCSHQRSDPHEVLSIINKFCAYHCNAYMLRSSVSMGLDSPIGGCSCAIAPDGTVLHDMKSEVGGFTVEFDPKKKYYKPAGFQGALMPHYEYIEMGRRPWKYRPAGSAICRHDDVMPYPRTCAHRGYNSVAPENSMPSFGAAVALGAEEIEFDIWSTKDGVLVTAHDPVLDRVSTGTGNIWDYTYEELLSFDFGVKYGEKFKGLKVVKFEEILKKFACHVIMNIHVKIWDTGWNDNDYMEEIVALIRQYDCVKWVYFMSSNDEKLRKVKAYAPDIKICVGRGNSTYPQMVERAVALGAEKLQFFWDLPTPEDVQAAHAHGIRCNYCQADDEESARKCLEMGVDCIMTNDYFAISQIVNEYKAK